MTMPINATVVTKLSMSVESKMLQIVRGVDIHRGFGEINGRHFIASLTKPFAGAMITAELPQLAEEFRSEDGRCSDCIRVVRRDEPATLIEIVDEFLQRIRVDQWLVSEHDECRISIC